MVTDHLPSVESLSIKQLLWHRLRTTLNLYVSDSAVLTQLPSQIPLHLAKDQHRVVYLSAIALRLSQAQKIPQQEIANALAAHLCHLSSLDDINQPAFTVQVVPPAGIHLELSERMLAVWLQSLLQTPPNFKHYSSSLPIPPSPLTSDFSCLFAVQYTHARCCSLAQLAKREKLMTLRQMNSDNRSAVWQVVEPNPIPWLNSEQKLCLCHPAERALIHQFLQLLDHLYCPCSSRQVFDWHKATLNLSQAFQKFERDCRIWGEVKSQNISLAQARLGLVLITQSILRLLLQERLGVYAPLEL